MATKCPISREHFEEHAGRTKIVLKIDDTEYEISDKGADGDRSKKSLGFGINERGTVTVGGVECPAMIQVNVTLIGSKIKS